LSEPRSGDRPDGAGERGSERGPPEPGPAPAAPIGRAAQPPLCERCGFPVPGGVPGCRNPCPNCHTPYPLGDCSD